MDLFENIKKEVESGNVSEYNGFTAKLAEYRSEVPDASTKEGYDRAKEIKGELTSARTAVEAKRKEYKKPILDLGRLVDSEAKRIIEEIKDVETPFHEAYKAVDDEKKRIKAEIDERIAYIKEAPTRAIESESSDAIEVMINEIAEYDVSKEKFGRRLDEASQLVASTLERLSQIHAKQIEHEQEQIRIEAERAELEKLRREAEEREAAQRAEEERSRLEAEEARIAEEAAQRAIEEEQARHAAEVERIEREKREAEERELAAIQEAKEAENRRIEAEKEAERQRVLAEEKAKRDAEEAAERARLEEVRRQEEEQARQKAEEEKREANKRHCAKIHNEIVEDLVSEFAAIGIGENEAKEIVTFIAKRKVRNLSIKY